MMIMMVLKGNDGSDDDNDSACDNDEDDTYEVPLNVISQLLVTVIVELMS